MAPGPASQTPVRCWPRSEVHCRTLFPCPPPPALSTARALGNWLSGPSIRPHCVSALSRRPLASNCSLPVVFTPSEIPEPLSPWQCSNPFSLLGASPPVSQGKILEAEHRSPAPCPVLFWPTPGWSLTVSYIVGLLFVLDSIK